MTVDKPLKVYDCDRCGAPLILNWPHFLCAKCRRKLGLDKLDKIYRS